MFAKLYVLLEEKHEIIEKRKKEIENELEQNQRGNRPGIGNGKLGSKNHSIPSRVVGTTNQ
jgi:hypothetical protein